MPVRNSEALKFRSAHFEDLESILSLYRDLRPHDPPFALDSATGVWHQILHSSNLLLAVGTLDNKVVATASLAVFPTLARLGQSSGMIENVVTTSSLRGRGIGRAMMKYLIAEAWNRGCYKITLFSQMSNERAHQFYQSLGFDGDLDRGFKLYAPGEQKAPG